MTKWLSKVEYNPITGKFVRKHEYKDGTHSDGYTVVNHEGKQWLAHRLAFHLMGQPIPAVIDHINGDRTDNRWCNLRDGSNGINQQNTIRSKRLNGIQKTKSQRNPWRILLKRGDKQKHMGVFPTFCEAVKARHIHGRNIPST